MSWTQVSHGLALATCVGLGPCVLAAGDGETSPQMAPAGATTYSPAAPPRPPAYPAAFPATERLVSPVALYPDPLLALLLPASTLPEQISAAWAALALRGSAVLSVPEPWDPSVQALCHYPRVLSWLAENPEWTRALGSAFAADPRAVMDAIQRVRARAFASGRLHSTLEQQVLTQDGDIEIIPAEDGALYVPGYDSEALADPDGADDDPGSFLEFGPAYPAGEWLTFSFNWSQRSVWVGGAGSWLSNGSWRRSGPRVSSIGGSRTWSPPPGAAVASGPNKGAPQIVKAVPVPSRPFVPAGSLATPLPRQRLGAGPQPTGGAAPVPGEPRHPAPQQPVTQPPARPYEPPRASPPPPPTSRASPAPPARSSDPKVGEETNPRGRDTSK